MHFAHRLAALKTALFKLQKNLMVIASIFGISQNMHKKLVSFAAYHLYILFFYRKQIMFLNIQVIS